MDYANLKSQLADTLGRPDLTAEIINAITWIETELSLKLRTSELVNTAVLTLANSSFSLPSDLIELTRVQVNGADIEQMNPETADTAYYSPVAYYMVGNELHIKVVPDVTDYVYITYFKQVPTLSDTNTTTPLLTKYPTLYITGALIYLNLTIKELEEAQAFSERFNSLVESVNQLHARRRGKPRLSPGYDLGQFYTSAV